METPKYPALEYKASKKLVLESSVAGVSWCASGPLSFSATLKREYCLFTLKNKSKNQDSNGPKELTYIMQMDRTACIYSLALKSQYFSFYTEHV